MEVKIVSIEVIKPSIPTPPEKRDFNLSFIDERIPHFYIPLLLYYTHTNMIQSEILNRLKRSLSDTLTKFYPLAGRFKGQTLVDCNDQGARYVEARVDSPLQAILESPEAHDLERLVPYDKANGIVARSEELLAVQVNSFACGGIAIGICVSHRVADGWSVSAFVGSWAARSNCGQIKGHEFESPRIFPPRGTPDFKPDEKGPAVRPSLEPQVTKRYVFGGPAIQEMKSKLSTSTATRFEVVSAVLWKSCSAAKEAMNSIVFFPVNLRRENTVQFTKRSFGNLYLAASAEANAGEDWPSLARKIKAAVEKINGECVSKLLGENGAEFLKGNFRQIGTLLGRSDLTVFRFTSWCGFPLYEVDFGWGRPVWVSVPSFGSYDSVTLFDSSCEGGVEAWVTMAKDDMARLEQDQELQGYTAKNCV